MDYKGRLSSIVGICCLWLAYFHPGVVFQLELLRMGPLGGTKWKANKTLLWSAVFHSIGPQWCWFRESYSTSSPACPHPSLPPRPLMQALLRRAPLASSVAESCDLGLPATIFPLRDSNSLPCLCVCSWAAHTGMLWMEDQGDYLSDIEIQVDLSLENCYF